MSSPYCTCETKVTSVLLTHHHSDAGFVFCFPDHVLGFFAYQMTPRGHSCKHVAQNCHISPVSPLSAFLSSGIQAPPFCLFTSHCNCIIALFLASTILKAAYTLWVSTATFWCMLRVCFHWRSPAYGYQLYESSLHLRADIGYCVTDKGLPRSLKGL